eukprot:gene5620-1613_t
MPGAGKEERETFVVALRTVARKVEEHAAAGHELVTFRQPDRYKQKDITCDLCARFPNTRTWIHGCRVCDLDFCESCAKRVGVINETNRG